MSRKVRLLVLDITFFERFKVEHKKIISCIGGGVHIENLIRLVRKLADKGHLPPDACMEWLYFDQRFNTWVVMIASETYHNLGFNEMAPLLEF